MWITQNILKQCGETWNNAGILEQPGPIRSNQEQSGKARERKDKHSKVWQSEGTQDNPGTTGTHAEHAGTIQEELERHGKVWNIWDIQNDREQAGALRNNPERYWKV